MLLTSKLEYQVKGRKCFIKLNLSVILCLQECSKSLLTNVDVSNADKLDSLSVAVHMLSVGLRCLSPFMPYLSEELYQRLPLEDKAESICIAPFPSTQQVSIHLYFCSCCVASESRTICVRHMSLLNFDELYSALSLL